MTRQELKKQLNRYTDLKKERKQIEILLNGLAEPKGLNTDGMPKAPASGDAMTSLILKRAQLQRLYTAKSVELADAMAEIEQLIEGLENRERTVMRYRYLDGLTWEKVCVAVNYSWKQTHRIHSKALNAILEAVNK